MNKIIAVFIGLLIVGYISWKLFWLITDSRREEGTYCKESTKKGFLWKELIRNIAVTALIIIVILSVLSLWGSSKDDTGEDTTVVEESEEEDEAAVYWEARYKIPSGLLKPVDSTAISEMGYDSDKQALIVRFKSSGKAYAYVDVPKSEWEAFRNAKSIGSYYNKNIKGKYKSYRMAGQ